MTFFYPDYTVGIGIPPIHALARSRALPPIGNYTLPRRLCLIRDNYIRVKDKLQGDDKFLSKRRSWGSMRFNSSL